jgi:hypothetical protein
VVEFDNFDYFDLAQNAVSWPLIVQLVDTANATDPEIDQLESMITMPIIAMTFFTLCYSRKIINTITTSGTSIGWYLWCWLLFLSSSSSLLLILVTPKSAINMAVVTLESNNKLVGSRACCFMSVILVSLRYYFRIKS